MKGAHHIEDTAGAPGKGDPIVGRFPPSKGSIRSEVLARLLCGEHMTSMQAVFGAGTTRLAPVIHVLRHKYGWSIDGKDVAVSCNDGHTATVASYSLSPQAIGAAGADIWAAEVFAARQAKRDNASQARRGPA